MDIDPDFENILAERKASARESLQAVTAEDVLKLVNELFTGKASHPWMETFSAFIREHEADTAYRGQTSDGCHFVFYPKSAKGIWYLRDDATLKGIGLISPKSMALLTEMVA